MMPSILGSIEGHLPKLGHPLFRQAGLRTTSSCRMARENHRSWRALAGVAKGNRHRRPGVTAFVVVGVGYQLGRIVGTRLGW